MKLTKLFIALSSVVFLAGMLSAPTFAQTVSNLYSFSGSNSLGNPGLVIPAQGRDGRLYGTTIGPEGTAGSIFRIATIGGLMQPFTFGSDGSNPFAGLTLGSDGNFYGTTSAGGLSNDGVLFRVSPSGIYTVLHEFSGGSDGASPFAGPIQASDSNFYGVTFGINGASTLYRLSHDGTFTTIYTFDTAHGQQVIAPLIQGNDDNLYGTASSGGANSCGTIFKVTTSGNMLFNYSLPCGAGGALPFAPLLQASDGNFYGTTLSGGNKLGFGTVFKLDQKGSVSILYAFKNLQDGGNPEAGLTQGTDGNLYGTTLGGGRANQGTLYELTTAGVHTVLYSFNQKGEQPLAAPLQQTNGMFYGTTYLGGKLDSGTIYSLDMGLGPFITFVHPVAKVGRTAQILGQGLTGTTSVTFNGVAATTFSVVSDTYMTAVVPAGATTGAVVVATPAGNLASNVSFRISK